MEAIQAALTADEEAIQAALTADEIKEMLAMPLSELLSETTVGEVGEILGEILASIVE